MLLDDWLSYAYNFACHSNFVIILKWTPLVNNVVTRGPLTRNYKYIIFKLFSKTNWLLAVRLTSWNVTWNIVAYLKLQISVTSNNRIIELNKLEFSQSFWIKPKTINLPIRIRIVSICMTNILRHDGIPILIAGILLSLVTETNIHSNVVKNGKFSLDLMS